MEIGLGSEEMRPGANAIATIPKSLQRLTISR
jgi:hypothetical protein